MTQKRPLWARLDSKELSPGKPRTYLEWQTLRRWGKLPPWERHVPGYLLRELREQAGLSQVQLADRLRMSQQAVSKTEQWSANPTLKLVFAWQRACGGPVGLAG